MNKTLSEILDLIFTTLPLAAEFCKIDWNAEQQFLLLKAYPNNALEIRITWRLRDSLNYEVIFNIPTRHTSDSFVARSNDLLDAYSKAKDKYLAYCLKMQEGI